MVFFDASVGFPHADDMPSAVRCMVLSANALREIVLVSHFVSVVVRFAHFSCRS
jgi:hypothetical protein